MPSKSRIRRKLRRLERGSTDIELTAEAEAIATDAVGWLLVDSWTHSVDVTEVDFTGLGAFTEIMVLLSDIEVNPSGISFFRASADNGNTFFDTNGDYNAVDTDGLKTANTRVDLFTTAAFAARTAFLSVKAWNQAVKKPAVSSRTDTSFWTLDNNAAVALNAVRIAPSSGGDITGGSIYIFGR